MEPMRDDLDQQTYATEARRLFQAGVDPEEIRRVTGFFVLSSAGVPLSFVT